MLGHPSTETLPGRPTERIVGLDGLRAVSILLVLVGHGWATLPVRDDLALLAPYLGNAALGVSTFFVISGFLITHLLCNEWDVTGTIRLRAFYARRALRILPALYAYLFVIAIIRASGLIETTYGDIAIAGTFLTNYKFIIPVKTNDDYWFVGHFWTLSLEEQFYLFWPATILAIGLYRSHYVAIMIVLSSPLVRIISYFAWPESRGYLSMMLHTAADPIMVGCLAALWQRRNSLDSFRIWFSQIYWPLSALIFLLLVSPWLASRFRGMYSATVGTSMNSFGIAVIMLWVITHPTSFFVRLLSSTFVRHIGLLSYSLYLWQQLFLTPRNQTWTGIFPINVVMCFALAEASFWTVERPFLRLRDRLRRG